MGKAAGMFSNAGDTVQGTGQSVGDLQKLGYSGQDMSQMGPARPGIGTALARGATRGGLQSVAQRNAQQWNNGGYQQWQQRDAQREQQFPPGTPVNNPALPPVPGAKQPINPFWGQ